MKLLYVRSVVCLGLLSDSASRRTPLPLAVSLALPPAHRDFHPIEIAHAGRTREKDRREQSCRSFFFAATRLMPERQSISTVFQSACPVAGSQTSRMSFIASLMLAALLQG